MSTVQDRVKNEYDELVIKHDKLLDFVNTDAFYALNVEHQCLLRAQLGAMAAYMWILCERLNLFKQGK